MVAELTYFFSLQRHCTHSHQTVYIRAGIEKKGGAMYLTLCVCVCACMCACASTCVDVVYLHRSLNFGRVWHAHEGMYVQYILEEDWEDWVLDTPQDVSALST